MTSDNIISSEIKSAEFTDNEIIVIVFFGNDKSVTEMKIGQEGKWTKMKREFRQGPYLLSSVPIGHPLEKIEHLWVAKLPESMPSDTQVIYFRSKDIYGQTAYGKRAIGVK